MSPSQAIAIALIAMARLYQARISPYLGCRCKFEPSCSQYFIGSVKRYGAFRGCARGLWRICRCNPRSVGGLDLP